MDFESALKYLESLVSYENVRVFSYDEDNFDLETLKDFVKKMEIPLANLKYLHVAGSKGKGTVANILATYLQKSGFKTALYTSPHLFDVRERISVNGVSISREDFADYVDFVKNATEKFGFKLTYFEILTLVALKFFCDQQVDYAILEVGLGGRLDATNIVNPLVSIITKIEEEHMDILGGSLSSIIDEKLGIAKAGIPLFIAHQEPKVVAMLEQKSLIKEHSGEIYFSDGKLDDLDLGLKDDALKENASLVFLVLKLLFKEVNVDLFIETVENLKLPGHCQVLKIDNKEVVFDVAHTKSSINNLLKYLSRVFVSKRKVFLLSFMLDKDVEGMLSEISRVADRVVFCKAHSVRGFEVEDLMKKAEFFKLEASGCEDSTTAFKQALQSLKSDEVLVVAGSNYLVAKALLSCDRF